MSVIWPSPYFLDTQGPHSSNLYPTALPENSDAARMSDEVCGNAVFHGLVSENGTHVPGSLYDAVNWTFYNRILLIPSEMDLGNIVNNQTRDILLWNGFLTTMPLQNLQRINDGGITLTAPVAIPYTLRPLEMLTYGLRISTDGPAVIDAQYVWTVNGVQYTVVVTGKRAVLFPFPPNFNTDVVESLEWRSDILRSRDGREQRRALRTKARRQLGYKISIFNRDLQYFQNIMWGWQNRAFAVPVWMDQLETTSPHTPGAMSVSVDPTGYSFVDGGLGVMFKSVTQFELIEINTVGSVISLKRPLEQSWPKGTKVYPVITGHLPNAVSTRRLTNTVLEGQVQFTTSPDQTDPYTPDAVAPVIYDGHEVITVQPNWSGDLDFGYEYDFDTVDMQTGAIDWQPTEIAPSINRKYRWLFSDRGVTLGFRQFLARQRGMAKVCWVPTWTDDFTIIEDVGATDTSIVTADNAFRQLVGANPARNRIMIRLRNGQVYYRRITGVSLNPDQVNTSLAIDAPFGVAFDTTDVRAVHFLELCRLATDKVDLVWKSDKVATVDTTFRTVQA